MHESCLKPTSDVNNAITTCLGTLVMFWLVMLTQLKPSKTPKLIFFGWILLLSPVPLEKSTPLEKLPFSEEGDREGRSFL